jgi:GH25 family lysozyme M1 (1,4-beta-N-acetylmuramidase)
MAAGYVYSGATVLGIDVSHHQGSIDWAAVATDPHAGFCVVRTGDGDALDRKAAVNVRGCRDHGIPLGTYHYLRGYHGPERQRAFAKRDNDAVATNGGWGLLSLGPIVDIEAGSFGAGLERSEGFRPTSSDVAMVVESAVSYLETMELFSGKRGMVYGGASLRAMYAANASAVDRLARWPLWLPAYASGGAPKALGAPLNVPNAWDRPTFHQYSSKGVVRGIPNPVDLVRYHGGSLSFKQWRLFRGKKIPLYLGAGGACVVALAAAGAWKG